MLNLMIVNSSAEDCGKELSGWISCPFTSQEWEDLMVKIKLGSVDESGEYHDGYTDGEDYYDEYYIGDVDTDYVGVTLSKYDSPFDVSYICERIEELTDSQKDALKALIDAEGCRDIEEFDSAVDRIRDSDVELFTDKSVYEIARDDVESGTFPSSWISDYVDYDRLVADCYSNYETTPYGVLALE